MSPTQPDELRDHLRTLAPNLADDAHTLWHLAKPIHDRSNKKDSHENGSRHAVHVEKYVWKLIRDANRVDDFSPHDLFLLSCSACCHDLDKGLDSALDGKPDHGVGSQEYVRGGQFNILLTGPVRHAIGDIISLHALKADKFREKIPGIDAECAIEDNTIDLQRLAVLLKAGDILHTDSSRVQNIGVVPAKLPEKEKSKYLARSCISGWKVDGAKIVLVALPDNDEQADAVRAAHKFMCEEEWPAVEQRLDNMLFPHALYLTIRRTGVPDVEYPPISPVSLLNPRHTDGPVGDFVCISPNFQAQPKVKQISLEPSSNTLPYDLYSFYAYAPPNSFRPQVSCLLTAPEPSDFSMYNIYISDKINRFAERPNEERFRNDANFIPLHPDIVAALGGKNCRPATGKTAFSGKIQNLEQHVSLENVLETAARHAKEWRFGCAIGCYRLASCLCSDSSDKDQRLQITCEPIRHLRHHVNYGILENTLLDVHEILDDMGSIRDEILLLLEYDLLALLNEHGLYYCALPYAAQLHKMKLIDRCSSDKVGSIKRRVYSIGLMGPSWFAMGAMEKLRAELAELAQDSRPLSASLATTQVVEALLAPEERRKSDLRKAYDQVSRLCQEFQRAFVTGEKPSAGPSDVAEMFYYQGLLAYIVRPKGWKDVVANSCVSAKDRFDECHALLTNPHVGFWEAVLRRARGNPNFDAPLLVRLTRGLTREQLPNSIKNVVEGILSRTQSMLVKAVSK